MIDIRGKISRIRLLLFTLLIFPAVASTQTSQEVKNMFAQAEAYYLFGDYELANPLYLTLAAYVPDNYNIVYKIGDCYLNIPDEKSKAIEFLEKAVKNSSYESKTGKLKEKRAPLDSYFSLAKAYLINNELEKAQATLKTFEKLVSETKQKGGMKNAEYIKQQILACNNAIKLEATPIPFAKLKLPPDFSLGSINDNPAVSFDGSTIAYTERRGVSNAIYFSKKERSIWQPPVEITMEINAGEDCSTSSLNSDGTELFLYKEDNEDGNIYSTTYSNGAWAPIKKLNKNINTKFYESHAGISADGKKLYFTSNREGGQGGLDIYVSEKDGTGDWGPADNLGATVNTTFNEDNPFMTRNDSVLYFSSEGHFSMGGFDIFRSLKLGDGWKTPENLGYPVNSTDDDKFFQPFNDGLNAYYSMSTDYKKKEIFYLGIGEEAFIQKFLIKGTYSLADTVMNLNENYKIHLINRSSGDTILTSLPDSVSGFYSFTVKPGSLKIAFSGTGYLTQTIDTTIIGDSILQEDNPVREVILDAKLEKDPEYAAFYERMNLLEIPSVANIDTSMMIMNMNVNDVTDLNINDSDILYYTVQVMALHNPVDISYFKYISDMKVMYNDNDKFYRYTTGKYKTREEAYARRTELIRKGYPEDTFIKKVSK
jgi:hypothetical protein